MIFFCRFNRILTNLTHQRNALDTPMTSMFKSKVKLRELKISTSKAKLFVRLSFAIPSNKKSQAKIENVVR